MPYTVEMLPSDPDQWLAELFEYEYCHECGGDACHHTAVTVAGLPFARCDYPPDDDGEYHRIVKQYRENQD